MVDKETAREARLARHLSHIVEGFTPYRRSLDRFEVEAVANDDAASGVSGEQRIECRLRVFALTLVPQL